MFRSSIRALRTLSAVLLLATPCMAQKPTVSEQSADDRLTAYEILPASSQAVVWIPDGDELVDGWQATQLYALASDESVAPFFEEQRQELEKRLVDAGWRLNVKPEDLSSYSEGQIALAWTAIDNPRKPFGLAMIADVAQDSAANQKLLSKIESELLGREARQTRASYAGVEITKYTLPKKAGELLAEDSYYAIVDGYFLSSDDQGLIQNFIARIRNEQVEEPSLSTDKVFREGRAQLKLSHEAQLEYFARPLGFARVLRAVGGKRSKSNADMLAVLENQGFNAIQCVCGEITLGLDSLDIRHRGYILVDRPLPKSAAVLDFPNYVSHGVPKFVGANISSLLATHWNAKDAFWRVEGLVDELAGAPGVFDEVIEGIKKDPNGPRIDIEQDVLPHFTNDIYSVSDSREGDAEVDSRRNLIALRLNNPTAMASVLDRAMKNEPDAELVNYEGQPIWKVVHREDEEVIDLSADFGSDFGAPPAAQSNQPQPWLSNWAITVFDEYLMFASHVEMIQEAIEQSQASEESPLVSERDYERVMGAIEQHFGGGEGCAWQIVRTQRAYRVQYELFRSGKLRQSQSMLASILDRLLQTDPEMELQQQKVSGEKLPAFDEIAHFLQPSGLMFRTTDNGWEFGSLMLAAEDAAAPPESDAPAAVEVEETISSN